MRTNFDPLKQIWKNRPAIPANPVEIQPIGICRRDCCLLRYARISKALRGVHADGMLVSAFDDIAWTLNLAWYGCSL